MTIPLRSRKEHDFGFMACPVWAVETPSDYDADTGNQSWCVDSIWFTAEEAHEYIRTHCYNLPGARVYGYAARGELKSLLDQCEVEP
jgi:hypothetical protein